MTITAACIYIEASRDCSLCNIDSDVFFSHRTLCEQLSRLSSDTNATVILLHEDGSSSSLSVPNDDPKQGVLGKGQIKANDGEGSLY